MGVSSCSCRYNSGSYLSCNSSSLTQCLIVIVRLNLRIALICCHTSHHLYIHTYPYSINYLSTSNHFSKSRVNWVYIQYFLYCLYNGFHSWAFRTLEWDARRQYDFRCYLILVLIFMYFFICSFYFLFSFCFLCLFYLSFYFVFPSNF